MQVSFLLFQMFFSYFFVHLPSKHSSWWRHLEDVLKTSWWRLSSSSSEDVFKTPSRRLDQNEYGRLSLTSSEDILKTSWSRPIYSSWPYVFNTSPRRLQDVFQTSWRRLQCVFKTTSRRLQDVFKASSRRLAKIFPRRFQGVPSG